MCVKFTFKKKIHCENKKPENNEKEEEEEKKLLNFLNTSTVYIFFFDLWKATEEEEEKNWNIYNVYKFTVIKNSLIQFLHWIHVKCSISLYARVCGKIDNNLATNTVILKWN